MVSLNRLKHKAKLIGCNVSEVDKCKNKDKVEKLMKVIDDKVKKDLEMPDKENEEGGEDGTSE